MKYILVIFIFGSFLFSQELSGNNVNSNDNLESLNPGGRPINTGINIAVMQDERPSTIVSEEVGTLNPGGHPINTGIKNAVMQDEISSTIVSEEVSTFNPGGRPMNP